MRDRRVESVETVKKGNEEVTFDYTRIKKRQKELNRLYFETLDFEYMEEVLINAPSWSPN